jgi:hypothetical protein
MSSLPEITIAEMNFANILLPVVLQQFDAVILNVFRLRCSFR